MIKKALIESFIERKGLDWEDSQVSDAGPAVPRLAPGQGPLLHARAAGPSSSASSTDEEINSQPFTPRRTTRVPTFAVSA